MSIEDREPEVPESIQEPEEPDVEVMGGGTLYFVYPLSAAGKEWAEENLHNGYQPNWPRSVVVEHRFIGDIVQGMQGDGLRVA